VPWNLASVCSRAPGDVSLDHDQVLSLWLVRSAETLIDICLAVASDPFVPFHTPVDRWIPNLPHRTRVYIEGVQNAASHARAKWGHVVAYTLTSCAYRRQSFGLNTGATALLEGLRFFTGG
jgi:hypothetical protein